MFIVQARLFGMCSVPICSVSFERSFFLVAFPLGALFVTLQLLDVQNDCTVMFSISDWIFIRLYHYQYDDLVSLVLKPGSIKPRGWHVLAGNIIFTARC
jgi:hypothetical protein